MEKYIINKDTLYIKKEENKVIIREDNRLINTKLKITKILDNSCMVYGSSFKGRKDFVNKVLNSKYKNPIFIDNDKIFLCVGSIRNKEFVVINVDKIISINKNNELIVVKFSNCSEIKLNISLNSFYNLIIKCVLLKNIINNDFKLKFL